jgi:hypothetical protein
MRLRILTHLQGVSQNNGGGGGDWSSNCKTAGFAQSLTETSIRSRTVIFLASRSRPVRRTDNHLWDDCPDNVRSSTSHNIKTSTAFYGDSFLMSVYILRQAVVASPPSALEALCWGSHFAASGSPPRSTHSPAALMRRYSLMANARINRLNWIICDTGLCLLTWREKVAFV